jgi:tRNA(Ile)-lysidine synthase
MPALAEEGGDARNLARLASRLARANAALEVLVDGAERYLALRDRNDAARFGFDASAFAGLSEEIRLRLLMRAIDRLGHEGPAELGKAEVLLAALDRAVAKGEGNLKQTLAGAAISLVGGRIHVEPAPPRRHRPG